VRVVAWDTETKGLRWFDPNEQAFLATWADEDGEYCADLSNPEEAARFREALESADVLVAHNAKFDTHQTRATLGIDVLSMKAKIHDTDLMSRVLYPEGQRKGERGGHGLKNLAKVYLRADADDPEEAIKEMAKQIGLRTIKQTGAYYQVWRAYPDVMERYALMDARYTFDIYQKFSSSMSDLRRVYDLEMTVFPILVRAEALGIRTDQAQVAHFKKKFGDELEAVREYLTVELGEEAIGGEGSEDALTESLLAIGVPLTETTPTGKLATNKFALQPFEKDYPQIAALFELRRLERFLSTYIGPMDGREIIHPSFHQCGAWTGRMSCSSPNMQNWPKRAGKEVRSVLVPREGHSFVVCDYESIEVRLLAYYLGDQGFRDMIASGHDPHAWMATNIWGGSVTDFAKGGPNDKKRGLAKNILFAITYGAGKRRVAAMLRDAGFPSSEDDAKAIISKIKASLPNYYRLNQRIRNKIEAVGHVNTIIGRKNPVGKDKSYVGLNALIQGSAADIMKHGLINVDRAVAPLGGVPLLVVHDEVVVEVPTQHADECLARTEESLIAASLNISPRLAVSGSVVHTSYADA
jgi:DNA polymerase I